MKPFALRRAALKAPFPWFGGKSRVAAQVWQRLGHVRNLVVPFCGSMAVELGCPEEWWERMIVTVNDVDAYLANFWRAVAADPDQVAHYADWPVNEADLHARHRWLVETARERVEQLKTDPDLFDPKVAGWWVWGQCLWIGSGWCARPEWTGHATKARGINAKDRTGAFSPNRRPVLQTNAGGHGVIGVSSKRPALTGNGGGVGVNAPSLGAGAWQKRPVLQHGEGGRGVHRLAHQVPDLSGDAGGFLAKSGGLLAYMRALSDRLRRVRVCCGDFERILGAAVTTCIGLTGVFLDPPYPEDGRAICYSHDGDGVWWRAYQWAIDHGDDSLLRIALCGYEHPDAVFPAGWEEVAWKASGGYGRSDRGKANARRERLWFSPGCLRGEQGLLFENRKEEHEQQDRMDG